jgi:GNAT superfamily N-acetyltransferase
MIRRARPAEVVDVRWVVLRQGRPRESAIFSHDDAGLHWVDEREGRVVAVASVLPAPWPAEPVEPQPGLQLRGMAVLPELRGTGAGAALLARIHLDLAAPMWCNARAEVEGFYTRAGWIARGALFEIAEVGTHRRMTWCPP